MERPDSTNYPVIKLIKGVLLNTLIKHNRRKMQHCTFIRGKGEIAPPPPDGFKGGGPEILSQKMFSI